MDINKRQDNETYKDYKKRIIKQNKEYQKFVDGKLIWDSKKQGTYIKEKEKE